MKDPFYAMDQKMKGEASSEENRDGMMTPPLTEGEDKEILMRSPGEYGPNVETLEQELACLHLERLEEKRLKELENLTAMTGMPVTQENGQRRYGPPPDCGITVPPRGSEVFVGKIPRDCYEPELVPVFETAGKIYELRLMMDFSGTNRGYCFVHYFTPEEAGRAVRELNGIEIRPGRKIGVVKSVDNCRLFFGNIPKDKNRDDIHKEVDKLTDGVVDVLVSPPQSDHLNNRGFAFVEFESHKSAAMARRRLMSGKIQMWGVDIAVDWAEPIDDDIKAAKPAKSPQKSKGNYTHQSAKKPVRAPPPPRDLPPRFQRGGNPDLTPWFQSGGNPNPPAWLQRGGNPTLPPWVQRDGNPNLPPWVQRDGNPTLQPWFQNGGNHGVQPWFQQGGNHDLPPWCQQSGNHVLSPKYQQVGNHVLSTTKYQYNGNPNAPRWF